MNQPREKNCPGTNGMLFREVQRFRRPQLWLLLAVAGVNLIGFVVYTMVRQLAYGRPVGSAAVSAPVLWIGGPLLIILMTGFLAFMAAATLVTEVTPEGIVFRFSPLERRPRRVAFDQLRAIEVRTFATVGELRDWNGRHLQRSNIYTVVGNRGVFLELVSGECLFLGSEVPERLVQAVSRAIGKNPPRAGA